MSVYTERAAELFGKGFNCSQAVLRRFAINSEWTKKPLSRSRPASAAE